MAIQGEIAKLSSLRQQIQEKESELLPFKNKMAEISKQEMVTVETEKEKVRDAEKLIRVQQQELDIRKREVETRRALLDNEIQDLVARKESHNKCVQSFSLSEQELEEKKRSFSTMEREWREVKRLYDVKSQEVKDREEKLEAMRIELGARADSLKKVEEAIEVRSIKVNADIDTRTKEFLLLQDSIRLRQAEADNRELTLEREKAALDKFQLDLLAQKEEIRNMRDEARKNLEWIKSKSQ